MLRLLFNDPPRTVQGPFAETLQATDRLVALLQQRIVSGLDPDHKYRKYEVWTLGLVSSLDELEQSLYASRRYAEQIQSTHLTQMTSTELLSYSRHIYFDKNTFIRVFSLLDKLGTLINDALELQTQKMKPHFSYFTVLRNMRLNGQHPKLMNKLNELKEQHKGPMDRLRKRRNAEIHYMNPELQDDLRRLHDAITGPARLENLEAQQLDLNIGYEVARDSLRFAIEYIAEMIETRRGERSWS